MTIPIIDLFAGPGGLGEGFSSFNESGESPFNVSLSIEKDAVAHQTLKLRSFVRQFNNDIPEEYYNYVKTDKANIQEYLYNSKFNKQHKGAESEAIKLVLGPDNLKIENLIKERIKSNKNWVLIGGPPCQAYSLIGRARMKGQENFAIDERHTLYQNYLQMIARFEPAVFVMENVKGMLSSKVNGESVFSRIKNDLSNPGKSLKKSKKSSLKYNIYSFTIEKKESIDLKPSDFIIKSEEYGIPQKRHRVILLGIRSDIDNGISKSNLLKPKKQVYVSDAIENMPRLRSRLSRKKSDGGDNYSSWLKNLKKLTKNLSNSKIHPSAIKAITQYIENNNDYVDGGRFTMTKTNKSSNSDFIKDNWNWFHDEAIGGVLNHQSRKHMDSDLQRYLFCSIYAQRFNQSAKLDDFPGILLPNHKNVKKGIFSDRFRVQLKNQPATTVTSHISKDGHYYIHYDPTQCRSLSVREAARLQTFPDNYFFEGTVTQQYHQVGNAVPPLLARDLANTVYHIMKNRGQAN
mgnify:CR=1 FL=1